MTPADNLWDILQGIGQAFAFSESAMQRMVRDFHAEMRRGLRGESGSLKMLPAFIDCPAGNEQGEFIGLDLGGTHFRVLFVRLEGQGRALVRHAARYTIPPALTSGAGVELFDFIARSIKQFLAEHDLEQKKRIALGFTFSFPIEQTSSYSGRLIKWTKGFSATGVAGRDVAGLLADGLRRQGIENMEIAALVNDTVGTLLAGAYADPKCDMGVIFGTGTNCCYRESTPAIVRNPGLQKTAGRMIVNIEWGNFNCLPVNDYDRLLDRDSDNPGKQRMEKMVSGMYLGELARLVIMDAFAKAGIVCAGNGLAKGGLTTRDMADLETDPTPNLTGVEALLAKAGCGRTTPEQRQCVREICRHVSQRAARIGAAAISAVATWMDPELEQQHVIGIDGTLYARYPGFQGLIGQTLKTLHGDKCRMLTPAPVQDGSGTGAAIAAAVALI